jgi:drug/metabolite transporter (DMT)-like permease
MDNLLLSTGAIGILWGIYPLLNKNIIQKTKISFVTLYGIFISIVGLMALGLLAYHSSIVKKDLQKLKSKDWANIAFVSLLFITSGFMFNYSSVFISPYKTLAFSVAFGTLISAIGSYLFFGLEITQSKLLWILVILIGIYFLNLQVDNEKL